MQKLFAHIYASADSSCIPSDVAILNIRRSLRIDTAGQLQGR